MPVYTFRTTLAFHCRFLTTYSITKQKNEAHRPDPDGPPAEGGSSAEYDEAMSGLMMQNHIDCMNTINNSMGDFDYFYSY